MDAPHIRVQRVLPAAVVAAAMLSAPAVASTWIVDVSNGPGTHYTDIPPAIAGAAVGDVILVRAGSYSGFTLTRGMTIIAASPNVRTLSDIVVSSVAAGELAVISGVSPVSSNPVFRIQIHGCAGTVLVQRGAAPLWVTSSQDVRIADSTTPSQIGALAPGLEASASRVQLVSSTLTGSDGLPWPYTGGDGDPGEPGIWCTSNTRLHMALSSARGGRGGDGWIVGARGGDGGMGLLSTSAWDHLCSSSSAIGGGGGIGQPSGASGSSAWVLVGTLWSSNSTYQPNAPSAANLIFTPTREPTLELIGTPAPGATITLRLHADPGVAVRLNLGSTPIVQPQPNVLVEGLVQKQRSFDRGLVPPSGVLDTPWLFQAGAPAGKLLIFQAKVTSPSTGLTQKSNSIEALVN